MWGPTTKGTPNFGKPRHIYLKSSGRLPAQEARLLYGQIIFLCITITIIAAAAAAAATPPPTVTVTATATAAAAATTTTTTSSTTTPAALMTSSIRIWGYMVWGPEFPNKANIEARIERFEKEHNMG